MAVIELETKCFFFQISVSTRQILHYKANSYYWQKEREFRKNVMMPRSRLTKRNETFAKKIGTKFDKPNNFLIPQRSCEKKGNGSVRFCDWSTQSPPNKELGRVKQSNSWKQWFVSCI